MSIIKYYLVERVGTIAHENVSHKMPIPPYSIDGILPPFVGSRGPGDHMDLMSSYKVTLVETVNHFATNNERQTILMGWLKYRGELRAIGIEEGFQWLDGSFVEDKESIKNLPPNDLDLVVFFRRPAQYKSDVDFKAFVAPHKNLFDRNYLKTTYHLDAMPVDMDANPETLVSISRYWLQLFSHQRDTNLWKGMLQVRHEDYKDEATLLAHLASATQGGNP